MTREEYDSRKALGVCTRCLKPLPEGWKYFKCQECLDFCRKPKKDKLNDGTLQMTIPANTKTNKSLDDMAKEAHDRHISYGQLQRLKMLEGRS